MMYTKEFTDSAQTQQNNELRLLRLTVARALQREKIKALGPILGPAAFGNNIRPISEKERQERLAAIPKDTRTPAQIQMGEPQIYQQHWRQG